MSVKENKREAFTVLCDALGCLSVEVGTTAADHRAPMARLCHAACQLFDTTTQAMLSSSREREVFKARSAVMMVAYETLGMSYRQIGLFFGGRDHSTVLHAREEAHAECTRDMAYRSRCRAIREAAQECITQDVNNLSTMQNGTP